MKETKKLLELEKKIGYKFENFDLLVNALTHSSYANEHHIAYRGNNERLEFLGDAVLEVTSSEFLFRTYPELPEGELTKKRASLVCERDSSGRLSASWKRGRGNRRQKQGFCCIRRYGSSDWSHLSGRRFC